MTLLRRLVFWFCFAVCSYAIYLVAVPVFHDILFKNEIQQVALASSMNHMSDAGIAAAIVEQARAMGVPVKPEQIQVARDRSGAGVSIKVHYTVRAAIPLHPLLLRFHDHQTSSEAEAAF